MNGLARAVAAGVVGSLTTSTLHEFMRRARFDAPRVDLLGMQALAKGLTLLKLPTFTGGTLYGVTLAADLVSNSLYFSLVGAASQELSVAAGAAIGIAAGCGAVVLPPRLGLAPQLTNRTTFTQAMSIGLYAAGGLAAGYMQRALASANASPSTYFVAKHVIVTGGSRGLGFRLAQQLLESGARVTICGRSADSLASAVSKLVTYGKCVVAVTADVRERADCERLIAAAVERNGPVDVLINNAGVIEVGPFTTQTVDDFREAMDTHFWGPLYTTLAVLPAMRARRRGHIVNVASVGGLIGVPHLAPYSASKFAQIGLTQAVGAELAADGVKVTSIIPGLMITGSPDHAIFKGRNRAEYAWFTLSDANPLLSVSADAAARRILRAVRRGEPQAIIGTTAKLAQLMNSLAPKMTTRLLRLAARLLPGPGGIGTDRRSGMQSQSGWTQSPLTALNTSAAARNNQVTDSPLPNSPCRDVT